MPQILGTKIMGQPGLVSWRTLRFAPCPVPKPGLGRFCEAQNIALNFKSRRKAKQLAFLCPKFWGQKLWGNLDLFLGAHYASLRVPSRNPVSVGFARRKTSPSTSSLDGKPNSWLSYAPNFGDKNYGATWTCFLAHTTLRSVSRPETRSRSVLRGAKHRPQL